jgi:hypothetical protein
LLGPNDSLDGVFSSMFTRARLRRRERTLTSLTASMRAAKEYFDTRTKAIESCIKAQEADYRLQQLPVKAAEEAERRREEAERRQEARAEELQEQQHRCELADLRRARERAEAEATLLVAQQACEAQRELGPELALKKRAVEMLDVDMALAERRAVLRKHLAGLEPAVGKIAPGVPSVEENALYEARAQLHASGLDTSALDAVLSGRNSGG